MNEAEEHPQRGGLAGPVGAEEAGQRAEFDVETERVHRGDAPELLADSLNRDGGHGHSLPCRMPA
jgi:hypothetical protein